MVEWGPIDIDLSADAETIWACQSAVLDHYERHPSSSSQVHAFDSSIVSKRDAEGASKELNSNTANGVTTKDDDSQLLLKIDTGADVKVWEEDEPTFRLLFKTTKGLLLYVNTEEKRCGAREYVKEDATVRVEQEEISLEAGTIVRGLEETSDNERIVEFLKKSAGPRCIPVASCDVRSHYGIVSLVNVMNISSEDVRVLRSVEAKARLRLYQDLARFSFVRDLKSGDEVDVEEEPDEMHHGVVDKRRIDDRGGYLYSVRMTPSQSRERRPPGDERRGDQFRFYDDYEGSEHEGNMLYEFSADRLYAPTRREMDTNGRGGGERMRDDPMRSREKNIPIRLLDAPPSQSIQRGGDIEARRRGENTSNPGHYRTHSSELDRYSSEERRERQERPPPPRTLPRTIFDDGLSRSKFESAFPSSASSVSDQSRTGPSSEIERRTDERVEERGRGGRSEDDLRYAQDFGWRMNDAYNGKGGGGGGGGVGLRREERQAAGQDNTPAVSVGTVDGWREGDRCQWILDGRVCEATVRWIGKLRGHQSIYVGLQFDDPVGQGTGVYQGQEVFKTKAGYAGFVMLSTISPLLISTSSNPNAIPFSSYNTQNQSRERPRSENGAAKGQAPPYSFNTLSYPVEDQVRNASPPRDVPISGQGAMIPPSLPRYNGLRREEMNEMPPSTSGGAASAFSARHRPLPSLPPPAYDADRATPLRPSPPPPVPPRPSMMPEDYMIESFDVDSCVDVCYKGAVRQGVVRWKGDAFDEEKEKLEMSAIVELEASEAPPSGWKQSMGTGITGVDHTLSTVIVPLTALRRDRRFAKDSSPLMGNGGLSGSNGYGGGEMSRVQDFGSIDSGVEIVRKEPTSGSDELVGRMKGIQGNRNSCYLDSMLYTLFVQCVAFDDILTRRRNEKDVKEYDELVRILSTEIVWPLRRFHYVRADHMMKFRKELEKALPNIKGLTSEEKDPEEILSALLRDVFKAKPFLKLINSKTGIVESTWLYHVVVDSDEWQGSIASSQHLLERSLRKDATKFTECPQVFVMQLPRYGVTKLFDKIVPLEKIDLTPFIHDNVFPCRQCGAKPAELYCHECYLTKEALYGEVSFCVDCFRSVHMREGLGDHADRPIPPPSRPPKKMTRYTLTLSGVLAIETSHYVSFVRSNQGRWLFFDSMADREGLQNGFNIPQVKECARVGPWVTLGGYEKLRQSPSSLPPDDPLVNRLLSDSYICIYTADPPAHTSMNSTTSLLSKLTKELKKI